MKLTKKLTLLNVFCIASGSMMSSGLFLLPGLAHSQAGGAVVFSYMLAGVLAGLGLLSQAELATAMPKTGGDYFYITRSMGPGVGTVYGLVTLLALTLKAAFALIGMAAFAKIIFSYEFTPWQQSFMAMGFCILFLLINLIGVHEAAKIQVGLVFMILALLAAFAVKGIPNVKVEYFDPFATKGIAGVFSTAGFVFVSYGGLLKVASIAEEVKNPGRTLPLGMIMSLFVVGIVYVVVVFVVSGTVPPADLAVSLTPISDAAAIFMGKPGYWMLSLAAIFAFSSAANAGILSASRYPMALSRDELLPEAFGKLHPKFQTPYVSIAAVGCVMIGALFLEVKVLVKMASAVLILTYLFSGLAVLILRESRLQNYRPSFRAPLYPYVQIAGTIGFIALLFEMGAQALIGVSTLVVFGLFLYWFYGRIRANREYALLHLVERITARELTSHSLEAELKEILHERDEVEKDRFDALVEDCIVLDFEEAMNRDELFHKVSEAMAERVGETPDQLFDQLKEREGQSTTAITSTLAIPHIIIEGEHRFDLLLARCKGGVNFSEKAPEVKTIFVLVGSLDERPFHLQSLAAIAAIVQGMDFEERWLKAKTTEGLRDIVLLGKRKRI